MENPETLTTITNGQSRDTDNNQFKILTGRTFSRNKMARKLSVSKGLYLKSIVSQSGTNYPMVVRVEQENLPHEIRLLGNIHLYVQLATCDLTSKTKGGAVSLNPIDQTQDILEQYQTQGQKLTIFSQQPTGLLTSNFQGPS